MATAATAVPALSSAAHTSSPAEKGTSPSEVSSSSSSTAGEPDFPRAELTELARSYTRQSTKSQPGANGEFENPFEADEGGPLDPFSPKFNARLWTKSMIGITQAPGRTAGFSFKNLSAYGYGSTADFQKTFGNVPWLTFQMLRNLVSGKKSKIDILQHMDGLVRAGEMLVVLGPPGSGCSTFLKTVSGETHGYVVSEESQINYEGISPKQMHHDFRGEAIYTAEVDVHFPGMTVGDTLTFAARARAPRVTPGGVNRNVFANHMRDVIMSICGISHTLNTKVGSDLVRGVSGGERKRVSIAEALLSGAPLQCWDNSTRGLDSANAIEFIKTLKMSADLSKTTACVAIYQAPQSAYDLFDKVTVLYEGRQIYFGHCNAAKEFFVKMGFHCPERQTTADFLTSLTSDLERAVQPGFEAIVPRTPDEFVKAWHDSDDYKALMAEIDQYNLTHPANGPTVEKFIESRRAQQSKAQRASSPYTLSYMQQVNLCLWRGFRRLIGQPELTITQIFGNSIMALIIGSVFYNLKSDSNSFFQRGALLFFAILLAAFASSLEILLLYAQRGIVEKHQRYALYHPSAEALASMLTDLPYKIGNCITFSITIYFLTNLRREPGPFFFFVFCSFCITMAMSMFFRTVGACSRTLSQALAPSAVLILALIIYTGFVIPTRDMLGWARWINYLDPIAYGFESLMVNEFSGRIFPCSAFVPSGAGYEAAAGLEHVCSAVGAVPGSSFVSGDDYINTAFHYYRSHKWRNIGIIFGEMFFLMGAYLVAAEYITAKKSKGEVLLFQQGRAPPELVGGKKEDIETGFVAPERIITGKEHDVSAIARQTAIFQWEDVTYDIKIKKEERRILSQVDGWVKPGTLTALMGVSGAGKTTLLDVLATRVTMGVVTGKMLVDGSQRDESFQRKTGYVQQQDLHLETSTVREALVFSALLRQPAKIPREEKLAYVDEVIKLLDMESYVDAVVGIPGEGLNVEQRKRLTIAVELAAKPELLLFDEPTSGLDSQTAWAICDLMRKLTDHGQAILCTIHQPSAMLFQRFDRLLFLAKGGKTIYFGEVGDGSAILRKYFESNGAFTCPEGANPAEWMLEVIGAAPGSHSDIDWHQVWLDSPERVEVKKELANMESNGKAIHSKDPEKKPEEVAFDKAAYREFAAPFGVQFVEVTKRVFQQYWRTPSYLYSKLVLCAASALFIGLSFLRAPNTQQGLQNQLFGVFMLMTIFGNLTQQIMPHFVTQRALYEVRERPSKAFSWKAFMLANILVELPWNALGAFLIFVCFYYPIGLNKNAEPTNAVAERGALFFLLVLCFMLFTSTFSHMMIAAIATAETAGNMGNLLFSLILIFCGTLAGPNVLPRFWIFMYRVSPFTYLVEGMLVTAIANTNVVCSSIEYLTFNPPAGQTCGTYMASYIKSLGTGYVLDPNATTNCSFCAVSDTNTFLTSISASYSHRWRNFGLMWVFIIFNIAAALFFYWLGRVPKKPKEKKEKKE